MAQKLIRFDWAVKKLLRNKANFGILAGFLSELLKFDVSIQAILESEGNKEDEYDKYNKVDILVHTIHEELILVEVQNDPEKDWAALRYFHRMLYGISKLITEYIKEGEAYGTIKKVFSINIVYFGLGQGDDYVYEYRGEFIGLHSGNTLKPTISQKQDYKIATIADIFPKYYILKVNSFNDIAKDSLDEWVYFLKNSEVKDEFKAKGLEEAKEKLRYENLTESEKQSYNRYQENRRIEKSVTETALQIRSIEIAKNLKSKRIPFDIIAESTGLSIQEIEAL
jgi:predicted transposase/invertase (TIGR01784 family)